MEVFEAIDSGLEEPELETLQNVQCGCKAIVYCTSAIFEE